MSDSELKQVQEWLDKNLVMAFIRPSSSSSTSPIFFIKKKDSSLYLYVDYRVLNDITWKDRYPLPQIEETLNQILGSKYFTWLDLWAAFNLIWIKKGDKWKIAIQTQYGLFEFIVMPFSLTNTPATC